MQPVIDIDGYPTEETVEFLEDTTDESFPDLKLEVS